MQLSDSKTESDKHSTAFQLKIVVAGVDKSSEEKREMDSKRRLSLKGLMANRNKGRTSKDVPKTQTPTNLPPAPRPADLGLPAAQDPKKKRTAHELEEGEVARPKGTKQQKTKDPRDKKATSLDCREDVEVHQPQCTLTPRIKLDGAQIP